MLYNFFSSRIKIFCLSHQKTNENLFFKRLNQSISDFRYCQIKERKINLRIDFRQMLAILKTVGSHLVLYTIFSYKYLLIFYHNSTFIMHDSQMDGKFIINDG